MLRARPMLRQAFAMVTRGIAFVTRETVLRIQLVEFRHHSIPRHFREYRCRTYRWNFCIAANYGSSAQLKSQKLEVGQAIAVDLNVPGTDS